MFLQVRLRPGFTIRAEAGDDASHAGWESLLEASPSRKGAWAEAVLEARAIALGFTPCRPSGVPAPYDLILERAGSVYRVQVKSAWKDKDGCFVFRTTGGGGNAAAYTPARADLLACMVVPLNVWYIIPVTELEAEQEHLIVTPSADSPSADSPSADSPSAGSRSADWPSPVSRSADWPRDRRGRRKARRRTKSFEEWKERWDLLA